MQYDVSKVLNNLVPRNSLNRVLRASLPPSQHHHHHPTLIRPTLTPSSHSPPYPLAPPQCPLNPANAPPPPTNLTTGPSPTRPRAKRPNPPHPNPPLTTLPMARLEARDMGKGRSSGRLVSHTWCLEVEERWEKGS